ncbi:SDR family oxidoreductase [Gammaproteobacteria bacterium]|nr:SDR family oxidoreductase [Gammaproteobacteria bacterium]
MLKGKNIVVTGALQGIGKETVTRLSSYGANLWACSHFLNKDFIDFCSSTSQKNNVNIYPLEADFNSLESVKEMGRVILKEKIPIHGLVNIAGITKDAIFQMTPSSDMSDIYNINFVATMVLTQLISKNMMRNSAGSIINISSISAIDGVEGQLSYSSSKSALIGATKTLARELGEKGIRINCIAPGVIDTEMNAKVPIDILKSRLELTSLKRIGEPSEVADTVAFLLSDLSAYMTGQVIRVDGGMS